MTTVIYILVGIFLLILAAGGFSVIVALLVKRLVPGANKPCSWCINGWCSKRGLWNRLVLAPLCITGIIVIVFVIIGLTDSYRIRGNITESTRMVVRSGGNCHRKPERERIMFETEDIDTIKRFAEQISISLKTTLDSHCGCCGEMTFDFYRNQELHYSFSLHHGQRIRLKSSGSGDKELSYGSQQDLRNWLNEVGITETLAEIRKQEEDRMMAELEKIQSQGSSQPKKSPDSK